MSFRITKRTLSNGFTAKQAIDQDEYSVSKLLKEAAGWLKSKGSSQWNELIESEEIKGLKDSIDRGESFYLKKVEKKQAWLCS